MSPVVDPSPPPLTTEVLGVVVEDGPAPPPWPAPLSGDGGCADEHAVLLPDGPARLYVAGGSRLLLDAPPGERAAYDYLLYSSGRRFLQLQRGVFGLHAAAVVSPDDRCVAILGGSGAGKTTVMVELVARGWRLGCDDTPDVSLTDAGPVVVPHRRPVHLDAEALRRLGAPTDAGTLIPRSGKRAVVVAQDLSPRRVDALVMLDVAPGAGQVMSTRLTATEAVAALGARSTMGGLTTLPAYRGPYLQWLGALATAVAATVVRRPAARESREETTAAVLAAVEEGRT